MKKKPIVFLTYENERISITNSLTYINCVSRLSWVVHEPIYGRLMGYKVYQGWGLQGSGSTDPPKENGRKFAPTAPIASKLHLGNTR